jgi:hypothetical protein
VGDLTDKFRGINNGCQTISTVYDRLKEKGELPPTQKIVVKINIGTSEELSKELTVSNNCHNSISEKDILLAFSDELSKSVEEYSDGEYTLKLKKGATNNSGGIVIDLTKQGRTNSMLSYILGKPHLNGSKDFKQYREEIITKSTGKDIVDMFKTEIMLTEIFKNDETLSKYHSLTNGYIKNPIMTAIKQLKEVMEIDYDEVIKLSIELLKRMTQDKTIKGWVQNKDNCLLFCEKLQVEVYKHNFHITQTR